MFESGHGPSKALEIHKEDLQKEYEDNYFIAAADRAVCPDISWVFNLYYNVFKQNYGASDGINMIASLQNFISSYNDDVKDNCSTLKCLEDNNFVVVIVSPLMKRILKTLATTSEIVFIDSSGNVDRYGCRVFLLIVNTCAGGFPIGIIITTSESEYIIYEGLTIYKSFIETRMFNGRGKSGPLLFMTDDSAAERAAIKKAFPNSELLLCIFHILQATWRYVLNGSNNIHFKDRQELFYLVKSMLYSNTQDDLSSKYEALFSCNTAKKYENFLNYVEKLYSRRQE